ncbi:MAG TPA: hypothetical protein VFL57_02230 [Bryobacteraceae bacterium]|nr:hypothetical protein [Bryobacteraceae bacterium]
MMLNAMGWAATALSVGSYFFREPTILRRVQAGASCVWIVYGLIIGSAPLVACNVIVAGAALFSSVSVPRQRQPAERSQTST